MSLPLIDRLFTIAVTATLTSAVWIVGGEPLLQRAGAMAGVSRERAPATTPALVTAASVPPARGGDSVAALPPVPASTEGIGELAIPVSGVGPTQLTDTYSQARAGGERSHDAIDIMAPEGTPVIAAAAGTVEKLFASHDGGNTIYVRSPDRTTIFYYAHLRDYEPGLAEGQAVSAGQRLGTVGYTGNASAEGPHLHFAIWRTRPEARWSTRATPINPYPLLAGR